MSEGSLCAVLPRHSAKEVEERVAKERERLEEESGAEGVINRSEEK